MVTVSPRASARAYRNVPLEWADPADHRRLIAESVNDILGGKINSLGDLTLTEDSATTTLTDSRIGPDSFIGFMATTANGAIALQTMYVSARGKQTATITHTNNSQTDRTFRYVVLG